MRKGIRKLISFTLLAALLLQLLPVSVFATEEESAISGDDILSNEQEPAAAEDLAGGDNLQDAEILFEETSLREENVKHFRLDNGSYIAVQYDTPVHYRNNNGKWTDFDNTLRPVNSLGDSGVASYRVTNGDSVRVFAADANAEVLLAVQKGDYGLSLTPVREADAELPAEPDPSAVTASYELSAQEAQTASVSAAVLETASAGEAAEIDDLLSEAQPDKIYSALEYPASFQGATLRYENYANTVKESIVISAPQSEYAYSFQLETDGLAPTLQTDGSILFSTEDGAVIYTIPAPYMIDDNGDYSYDAAYSLTGNGDTWILTVIADAEWMNDPSRAYPVAIDPTVTETTGDDIEIFGGYVRSIYPSSPDTSDTGVYVGHNSSSGKTQSYFHMGSLISLPLGSEICYAGFSLYHYAQSGASMKVDIHEVPLSSQPSDWQTWANNLTWNNRPDYNPIVIDRQELTSANCSQFITWDVTKLAFDWYENEGSARCFALTAENEDTTNARATFYGPRKTTNRPRFTIAYRNTAGVESQYSYQTIDIGRAGTSYVCDYSMQNTLVVPIVVSNSDVNPFSLSLVYNSIYDQAYFTSSAPGLHTKTFSSMYVGAGWKLSAQQTVVSQSVGGTTYLIYNDSDGTEHYFRYCSDGYYRDEDGLGLKIAQTTGLYTMSDDYGNTKKFTYGFLSEETDAYGNAIYYAYNGNEYSASSTSWKPTNSSTNRLTSIWRMNKGASYGDEPAEQLVLIGYSGNFVNTIISECDYDNEKTDSSIGKDAHRTILTRYDTGTLLTIQEVTYPDAAKAQYTYYASGRLKTAYDEEANYGIEYSYSWNKDVRNIYEYVVNDSAKEYGTKMHGYKRSHLQAVYRYYGDDRTADESNNGSQGDDILMYKVFDSFGRTIGSYNTDSTEQHILGVGAAAYTTNSGTDKTNNRIIAGVSAGQQGVNLLKNSRVDDSNISLVEAAYWNKTTNFTRVDATGHYAEKSLELTRSSLSSTKDTWYQNVSLTSGKEYTFSAYIKVPSATTFDTGGGIYLEVLNSSGGEFDPVCKSEVINYSTESIDNGWARVCLTFTAPSSSTFRVALSGVNYKGNIYADDFQLEQEDAAATFNLLGNASFEHDTTIPAAGSYGWYKAGDATIASDIEAFFGNQVACLSGSGAQRVNQNITLNLPLDSTFILSAWAKANALPGSVADEPASTDPYFGLIIRLYFSDDTSEVHYFPFDPYTSDWQYTQGIVVPKKTGDVTISSAAIVAAYDNNANTAYIDNISLRIEPAQTYRYDSNGNIVCATSSGSGSESSTYSGVDLTQYTAANGNQITYTYNSKHDVQTATVAGVKNTYTYNTSGNVTNSKLTATGETKYMESAATITADRNHTTSSTDVNGNTTYDTYDGYLEKPTAVTNAKGQTLCYTYNTRNGRPTSVYQSGVAQIAYTFGNGSLTQLSRKTKQPEGSWQYQYYNLSYNNWGQRTTFAVGSQMLSANTYEPYGGNLKKTEFANGQYVQYTYDEFDRKTQAEYNNGRYIRYFYNAEGSVSKLTYGNGTTEAGSYQFEYDSLGRAVRSTEYRAGSLFQRTEHLYDAYNRLNIQRWVMGEKTRSEKYTYSDGTDGDGSLTQLKTGSGHKINYTYDKLKRLKNASVVNSSNVELFKTACSYRTVSGNQSSAQVEFRNIRTTGGDLIVGYKYSYDALGNITQISQSEGNYNPLVKYTYDSQNQLTKEVHYDGNGSTAAHITHTYTYTYDTAGNIQSETKTVGNTTTTKSYTYSTGDWKDLLIEVGGTTISYDSNGNPSNWYNGSKTYSAMKWANGRQLTSVTIGSKTADYAYDANGIRTQKTVGNVTHTYYTLNGKLMRETFPDGDVTIIMDFIYDETGKPFAVCYSKNGGTSFTTYFYGTNAQGDVEKIFRVLQNAETGKYEEKLYGYYTYDAWGNVTAHTASGNTPGSTTLVYRNPIRYRGYVYDNETGWYYLQSRYYDPANHRFINADSYASTGQGILECNMFAYCGNNPVNLIDNSGHAGELTAGWAGSMWWLPFIDGPIPIGEIIYFVGCLACGIADLISYFGADNIVLITYGVYDVYNSAKHGGGSFSQSAAGSSLATPPNGNNNKKKKSSNDKKQQSENKTPGNNQAQNRQARAAVQRAGLNKNQARILHDEITGQGFDYKEILEIAYEIKELYK